MELFINILIIVGVIALLAQAFIGGTFFISCLWEKEKRASLYAGLQFFGMIVLLLLFLFIERTGFFRTGNGQLILIACAILGVFSFFLLGSRIGVNKKALLGTRGLIDGQVKRFDQRETVFCRNRAIRPGSDEYKQFYKEHPHYEEYDKRRREMGMTLGKHPGLLDRPYDRSNIAATMASWNISIYLEKHGIVKPGPHPEFAGSPIQISQKDATKKVKGYTKHLGADLVGITELDPLWTYSNIGEIHYENWEDWGKAIPVDHKYAVVFATEMDFEMVGTGPHTPTNIESMQNYAKGAYISVQLAAFISNHGFSATANHHRHFETIMVPLAVDAGLGEMGRLGYLLTKEYGPRVRLAAVTTDMPLMPDKPVDIGVEHFCKICKKCATCCPSNSIPLENQNIVNGIRRWKLNAETCFEYWAKSGTDCNVCMRVCPWGHASTFPHRIIKEFVSRNRISRSLFNIMDDIFYGKKPKPKKGPEWAEYNKR